MKLNSVNIALRPIVGAHTHLEALRDMKSNIHIHPCTDGKDMCRAEKRICKRGFIRFRVRF